VKKNTLLATFAPGTWPFWAVHLGAIAGAAVLGLSWTAVGVVLAGYYVRLFFVTAGHHRYFSHRSYKTSRWFQFVLGLGATMTAQKGPLWWAANHRHHHKTSDQADDIHSPRHGLLWSHVGWFLAKDYDEIRWEQIKDLARYPELRWLDRYYLVPVIALAALLYAVGGLPWLTWGFLVPTTLAWHGTFTINSLSHVFGKARYATGDDSKNNWLLALLTMGEGWHNNHHHYQRAANQGWRWYEIDMTYYLLVALGWLGIVSDVRRAPAHVVAGTPKPRPRAQTLEPAPLVAFEIERAA